MRARVTLTCIKATLIAAFILIGLSPANTSAATFVPRTSRPSLDNTYFYSSKNAYWSANELGLTDSGKEILKNDGNYGKNCTWYAYGRAYEILGTKPKLPLADAKKWLNNPGYSTGTTPKLGAIAVWASGTWGHVAVVEKIEGNTVYVSESGYGTSSPYGWQFRNNRSVATISSSMGSVKYIYIGDFSSLNTITVPDGVYEIESASTSKKVLSVPGSNKNNGADLELQNRTNSDNQRFRLLHWIDNTYSIVAMHTGQVIEIEGMGTADGTLVQQYSYAPDANENTQGRWYIVDAGAGMYKFINKFSGKTLDIDAVGGTIVQTWSDISSATNQKFLLKKISPVTSANITNNTYYITARNGMRIAVGTPTGNAVSIHLWGVGTDTSYQWEFTRLADNLYKIVAKNGGKAMTVENASMANQAVVFQYDGEWASSTGSKNDEWYIVDIGGGYYNLVAGQSGKLLEVRDNSIANGTKLQQYSYMNTAKQQFRLEKVNGDSVAPPVDPPAKTKPTAPASISLTKPTSSSIKSTWTAPSSDGNSAITGYTISLTNNFGATQTATTNASTLTKTYTNLYVGKYTSTVTAKNAIGTSASKKSSAITLPLTQKTSSAVSFTDTSSSTHKDSIAWAYQYGITSGTSATKYSPKQPVTREQMATFIYRLVGQPTQSLISSDLTKFTDVSSSNTHRSNIAWLSKTGITSGTSADRYSPRQSVTREQMATFLYRLAGSPPYTPTTTELAKFTDVTSTNTHRKNIAWLAKTGITSGTSANKYSPKQPVTREQMATFMKRFYDLAVK